MSLWGYGWTLKVADVSFCECRPQYCHFSSSSQLIAVLSQIIILFFFICLKKNSREALLRQVTQVDFIQSQTDSNLVPFYHHVAALFMPRSSTTVVLPATVTPDKTVVGDHCLTKNIAPMCNQLAVSCLWNDPDHMISETCGGWMDECKNTLVFVNAGI